ncbi:SPFH domain-containing protein [Nocardioides sp. cx-173]|uniref:SPFH domain-containing protein n=1 Tax=Nocardioides sp. cx-173 TaxID=2898796 RepID=UPI001E4EA468|nr:SPFH domain-containing protein [Nocardioides sp. cx-173]MCD4525426.1 SPFH domain-containing protein [Nocardioides sp. cx-173]UGB40779.1 SPFH domain-containing protein [Nocardioides sp. cx-173]
MDEYQVPMVALLGVPLLALLATVSVRWVPEGHVLVVIRRGIVSRVTGAGLRLRWPGVDRAEVVPVAPQELPLVVRADTADGRDVRLLVLARVTLVPPSPLERFVEPLASAEVAAQRVLAEAVRRRAVADLAEELTQSWPSLVAAADAVTRPRGVRVVDLELVELDVLLVPSTSVTAARGSG